MKSVLNERTHTSPKIEKFSIACACNLKQRFYRYIEIAGNLNFNQAKPLRNNFSNTFFLYSGW